METFRYRARNLAGEVEEGVRQADLQSDVLNWLRSQSLIPIQVKPVARKKSTAGQFQGAAIKSSELAAFCWQLTAMVEGGVTIATALDIFSDEMENRKFAPIVKDISDRMKRGESFSQAISEYPKTFNNLFRAMILVSESSGNLPLVLKRLASYYDEKDKLARKIKGALAYPVFAVVIIVLILVIFMTVVIPSFTSMFNEFGGGLPTITKGLMVVYEAFKNYSIYMLLTTVIVVSVAVWYGKTPTGHIQYSKLALKLPLFGKLIQQTFVATFCRTAGTLLGAGVSIIESLDIISQTSNNYVIKKAITSSRDRVLQGSSVSEGLQASEFFPRMLITMITAGEESGSLPDILDKTSVFYDRKVEATITTMMSLIEPILIVIVGSIVLVLVLALYMPIFTRLDV